MSIRKRIAILVGEAEAEYQEKFLRGFLSKAFRYDYDVCVFAMYQRYQESTAREVGESSIYSLINYKMFDAMVLMLDTIQTPGLAREIEERVKEQFTGPVLCVDAESKYFPYIELNYYETSKKMISHLIEEHGLTDIAYLTGREGHKHSLQRLQAFRDCMKEHGLSVDSERIFYGDYWYGGGQKMARKILKQSGPMPQAIACANDFMAIGVAKTLSKKGVRIPEDIAIVGYDSVTEGQDSPKPITSVPMPTVKYGEYVANCMRALFDGKELPEFEDDTELFIGSSCGCRNDSVIPKVLLRESWDTETSEHSFFSPNNHMKEDLLCQTTFYDLMKTLDDYLYHIRDFDSFHICLNEDWNDFEGADGIRSKEEVFSNRMLHVLECEEKDTISFDTYFDKELLLPELQEEHSKPRVYYFTPLYFEERIFGYASICYQNRARSYTATYRMWLRNAMQEFECFRRIEAIQRSNQMLEASMIRDALTGMYNYNGFMKQRDQIIREVIRTGSKVGILAIDIKDLMKINELYGRTEGDRTITTVATTLEDVFSNGTGICFGNGELVMILLSKGDAADELQQGYKEMLALIAERMQSAEVDYSVDMHYGIEEGSPRNKEELERLVNVAISKKNGNKINERKMSQGDKLTEEEYKEAQIVQTLLDDNRFNYHFQPIVNAKTGEIFGYEALMRPDVDPYMPPPVVLKYAEYYGRLYDVERATFFNVLDIVGNNREIFDGRVKVFINSIPGNMLRGEDAERLERIAEKLKDTVVVELIEQMEATDAELSTLKEYYNKIGFRIAIDDYGAGFSNVTNLLRYMPNCVKIDRMLLTDIQDSPQKQHFVKDIITFSHDNNITVLAEGVETLEELQMVIHLGVDLIQGYYTAKPSKDIVSAISKDIKNEIVEISKKERHNKGRRVYEVGKESRISLARLIAQKYSVIEIADRGEEYQEVMISGMPELDTDMYLRVKDGCHGKIILDNASLQGKKHGACIDIGNDCDVTIVLNGENRCMNGGIRVPADSRLTIEGDGHLHIDVDAANYFGIGNDIETAHGELIFAQDGTIEIKGNGMKGIAIGSGLGGTIRIQRGKYAIRLMGQYGVGVGSFTNDTNLICKDCDMKFDICTSRAVGIGSVTGDVQLDLGRLSWVGDFNAKYTVALGTLQGNKSHIELSHCNMRMNIRGQKACGIGGGEEETSIRLQEGSVFLSGRGIEAIAWGNRCKNARIKLSEAKMESQLSTSLDTDIGAEERNIEIVNAECIYMLNGEKKILGSD